MRIIESSVDKWSVVDKGNFLTEEGVLLQKNDRHKVCEFSGVPATLINVDESHGTRTTLDVLQADKAKALLMVSDNNELLSVLDPRSKFMPDAKFEETVNMLQDLGLKGTEPGSKTIARRVIFDLNSDDKKDIFVGDVFRKRLIFERCAEGGCFFGIQLLRLVCTNGCMVEGKQFKKLIRSSNVDQDLCKYFVQQGNEFQVAKFLKELFFDQAGNPYQASVANYLGMRDELAKATDSDMASEFFPIEPISEHYSAQGISVSGAARAILDHLPSGLEYYKCFNILTNGIKQAECLTLQNEINVAQWASDNKMKFVRANNIPYQGLPEFNETYVRHLMGDVA